ncbi:MAG: hypothetical protein E6447_18750, partial [Bradyrhizobium sp.]|nr:hypothetical protein [Bradyrhizobium sp.]
MSDALAYEVAEIEQSAQRAAGKVEWIGMVVSRWPRCHVLMRTHVAGKALTGAGHAFDRASLVAGYDFQHG